jgi:hypothetical protein
VSRNRLVASWQVGQGVASDELLSVLAVARHQVLFSHKAMREAVG